MKDRKQLIQGLAFAILVTLCGFILFVRPNLDASGQAGVPADPESRVASLDAILPAGTTPEELSQKLTELAGTNVKVVSAKAAVVQDGGPAYRVELNATGPTNALLTYLSALSRAVYREGAGVRSSGGPLYVIEQMTMTPGGAANTSLKATLLVPGQTG